MKNYVILVLAIILGIIMGMKLSSFNKNSISYIKSYETDTISITEYVTFRDTIFVEKPKYYKEVIRDTVPIEMFSVDGKNLLISQKQYCDSNYIAWVSGIDPRLDSIMVFKNTEYVYKTKTIETVKTIDDKTGKIFAGAGIYRHNNTLTPKANIAYQLDNVMVGASFGICNNKPIYGIDFYIKLK